MTSTQMILSGEAQLRCIDNEPISTSFFANEDQNVPQVICSIDPYSFQ